MEVALPLPKVVPAPLIPELMTLSKVADRLTQEPKVAVASDSPSTFPAERAGYNPVGCA
jgi:hypothetical protein